MIRINLLKPLQAQRPMTLADEKKGGGRLVMALVALVLVGGGVYFLSHRGAGTKPAPEPRVDAPPKAEPPPSQPKRVTADAVEEIVREAAAENAGDTATPGYADLAPSQRIAYQHLAGTRMLRDLQAATPPEIGFAQIIFTPPGEFYVHGLAASEPDLKRFEASLATLPGSEIRQSLAQPVGAGKTAREFSFFGKVSYPAAPALRVENRVVAHDQLAAALKGFSDTARELGVDLQAPRLQKSSAAGGVQRLLYKAEARCDYARMEAFLEKLQDGGSSVGLLRVALEARGDEKMVASLDLLVYAQ